jgi:hypothetical protein
MLYSSTSPSNVLKRGCLSRHKIISLIKQASGFAMPVCAIRMCSDQQWIFVAADTKPVIARFVSAAMKAVPSSTKAKIAVKMILWLGHGIAIFSVLS